MYNSFDFQPYPEISSSYEPKYFPEFVYVKRKYFIENLKSIKKILPRFRN